MSYEFFRTKVLIELQKILPEDQIPYVINVVDNVATGYDVKPKEMSLSIVGNIPEAVKYYIQAKMAQNLTEGTLREYYSLLRRFFLAVPKCITDIDANDIRNYLLRYQLDTGVTNRTMEQKRIYLNGFFDWCVNNKILDQNPCKNVEPYKYYAKPRDIAESVELEMLRSVCSKPREKALVDILYSSGVRVSELCNLNLTDVNWERRSLHIRHGKGNKDRYTYFNAECLVSLQKYLNSRTDDCPSLFVNEHGKEKRRVKIRAVEACMKNLAVRAGVEIVKAQPHSLRHTFATLLIRNGCPVHLVQRMMGHSKISTTMIYTTIYEDDVMRSHEQYAI